MYIFHSISMKFFLPLCFIYEASMVLKVIEIFTVEKVQRFPTLKFFAWDAWVYMDHDFLHLLCVKLFTWFLIPTEPKNCWKKRWEFGVPINLSIIIYMLLFVFSCMGLSRISKNYMGKILHKRFFKIQGRALKYWPA